ncbi:hypothetical protein VTK73DRAFT_448 [Phialemonium thermophilum]|uniref:Carboxylic ester hydrolase n=1 Tax=Phialemonium thermophilum TaxID=223376 RepID=A0ABR3XFC9_9PEZI
MFMIPGMQHCEGTEMNALWHINAGLQTGVKGATYLVPGFMDTQNDVVLSMMDRAEKGVAPDQIIATKCNDDTVNDSVQIQWPICMRPKQAKYLGFAPPPFDLILIVAAGNRGVNLQASVSFD